MQSTSTVMSLLLKNWQSELSFLSMNTNCRPDCCYNETSSQSSLQTCSAKCLRLPSKTALQSLFSGIQLLSSKRTNLIKIRSSFMSCLAVKFNKATSSLQKNSTKFPRRMASRANFIVRKTRRRTFLSLVLNGSWLLPSSNLTILRIIRMMTTYLTLVAQ